MIALISVVMSARNSERYIAETIESVLNQTYKDFEFLIVNNGSTDRTEEIIQQYAQRDARVIPMQHPQPGWTAAVNQAMRRAKYDWIARIDADDVMLPHRLERQLQAIQSDPDVILWGAYAYQIDESGHQIGFMEHGPTTRAEFYRQIEACEPVFILNPTIILRRDVALDLGGFNEKLVAAGDEELWSRMRTRGVMLTIPEPLIKYRIHNQGLTARYPRVQMFVHRFIRERCLRAQRGVQLTVEAYESELRSRSGWKRAAEYVDDTGRILYRRSGAYMAAKRYPQAILTLGAAAILSPYFTITRLAARYIRKQRHHN